jgi:peroxiredoxin
MMTLLSLSKSYRNPIGGLLRSLIHYTVIILLIAFNLFGCDRSGKESEPTVGREATPREDLLKTLHIERPDKLVPAHDFTLEDVSGKQISLASFSGKVIFLNFWATWCAPCVQEMPTMEKLHQEFAGDGLVVLAVNYRESAEQVNGFLTRHKLSFPSVLDPDAKVAELYQVWGLPATFIINRRLEIVGKVAGSRDWHSETTRALFRQLLAEIPN